MFEAIDTNISRYVSLTQAELEYFHSLLELVQIKKKTLLLQPGDVCTFEAFINKGCLRTYSIDANGFDVILSFSVEDWWVSDIGSFSNQVPSKLYIEALEDSELLTISFANKERLFKKIPIMERLFRLMVQKAHTNLMNRLISTISETADQRYLNFISRYPTIPNRVPQHLIASYLGISPEFLSKIRKKIARNGR